MLDCKVGQEVKGFQCTGSDESATWKKLHNVHKKMNCDHCANETFRFVNGLHDMVNMGLGKKAHTVKDFHYLRNKLNDVNNACQTDGRC